MYQFTAAQLRDILGRTDQFLRIEPNSTNVRNAARNLAQSFADPVLVRQGQAQQLPTITLARRAGPGAALPTSRDSGFDTAIADFIAECYASIERREVLESRIAANAHLTIEDCKALIITELRKTQDITWASDLVKTLGLSDVQVIEALQELEHEDAIEGQHGGASDTDIVWHVRLTVTGRRIADGRVPLPSAGFGQTVNIFHAPVANAGTAENVMQIILSIPPLPSDIRAFLVQTPMGQEQVHAYERESSAPKPNRALLGHIASTIKTLIETANVSTELVTHAHEWFAIVSHVFYTLHT